MIAAGTPDPLIRHILPELLPAFMHHGLQENQHHCFQVAGAGVQNGQLGHKGLASRGCALDHQMGYRPRLPVPPELFVHDHLFLKAGQGEGFSLRQSAGKAFSIFSMI